MLNDSDGFRRFYSKCSKNMNKPLITSIHFACDVGWPVRLSTFPFRFTRASYERVIFVCVIEIEELVPILIKTGNSGHKGLIMSEICCV